MFPAHCSLKTKAQERCASVFWNGAWKKKLWHECEIRFLSIFREETLVFALLWNSKCSWTLDNPAKWFGENKQIKGLWINAGSRKRAPVIRSPSRASPAQGKPVLGCQPRCCGAAFFFFFL